MSVTVRLVGTKEHAEFKAPRATLTYLVYFTTDEAVSRAWLNSQSPAFYYGLPKLSIDQEYVGGGVWTGTAEYGMDRTGANNPVQPGSGKKPQTPGPDDPLDESYQFSTRGGTRHITQCLRRIYRVNKDGKKTGESSLATGDVVYDATLAEKDKAVGVDEAGTVHGCDVYDATFHWTRTVTIPVLTLGYLQTLRDLTATVSQFEFFHFQPGEVLFLGADGEKRGPDTFAGWVVTYGFHVSPNLTLEADPDQLTIVAPVGGTTLEVPAKDGWDHLWVRYTSQPVDGRTYQIPVEAYVDRVYPRNDFDALGIGGRPPPPLPGVRP